MSLSRNITYNQLCQIVLHHLKIYINQDVLGKWMQGLFQKQYYFLYNQAFVSLQLQ